MIPTLGKEGIVLVALQKYLEYLLRSLCESCLVLCKAEQPLEPRRRLSTNHSIGSLH